MAYRETQIDEFFPVAGVDNESQGFRDNFSAIKDTLVQIKSDVEDIQETRLDITSLATDLNGNTITNFILSNSAESTYTAPNTSSSQEVNFELGSYTTVTLTTPPGDVDYNSPVELEMTTWPETGYAKMRIHVYGRGEGYRIPFTFIGQGAAQQSVIKVEEGWPTVLDIESSSEPMVFEFWTTDAGNNVFGKYLGEFSANAKPPKLLSVADSAARDALDYEVGTIVLNIATSTVQVCVDDTVPTWVDLN